MTGFPADAEEIIGAAEVQTGFDNLAAPLQALINERECLLLGVMNGGLYPLMQLLQRLQGDYLVDYCHVSRYRDSTRGGELHWLRPPPDTVKGRTVVVIDDIFDEGETLQEVLKVCRESGASEACSAVAFVKANPRRPAKLQPDYSSGMIVPDRYVFGCGMDYSGRWRHLPSVYALPPGAGT